MPGAVAVHQRVQLLPQIAAAEEAAGRAAQTLVVLPARIPPALDAFGRRALAR
jgi:hypothetical protein